MASKVIYSEVVKEMKKKNENQQDLANLLGVDKSQVSRKLRGEVQWTFGDAEIMLPHYRRGFKELFKKEEE